MAYNDAGQPTSLTYSDGEVLGTGYNAQGWLNQVQTTPSGGSPFTLATGLTYTGNAGAAMQPTSASIANGTYTYTASFDNDLRLTTDSLTTASATLYSATRGYDAVGNVVSEDTQLGASTTTDNQVFCYNAQNQLTWAGATGTSPCNGAVSSGTLTSAQYSQAYSYDAQGRLTSASLGSYTYGDASHPHAVTAIGSGAYSASYDAAGDMTCRAPNSSVTCSGTPTGQTMSYDAERRQAHWQNTPTTPTVQDDYLYDGAGQRVEQYVNTSGTITSTAYLLGGVEEVSGGVVTKYLGAKGLPTAVRVGTAGALNYLASDGLGSVSVAVDGSGNVVASQLYAPYGNARYSSGTMPTSRGFTGQVADATSGLDYYGARYYDPAAGQFTSADSVMNGLSRYAYVGGNPETTTDPSGHWRIPFNYADHVSDLPIDLPWHIVINIGHVAQYSQSAAHLLALADANALPETAADKAVASQVAQAQDDKGGVAKGIPTGGEGFVVVYDSSGNYIQTLYPDRGVRFSNGGGHAEDYAVAEAWLLITQYASAHKGVAFTFSVNIIVANGPCSGCQTKWNNRAWINNLQQAATKYGKTAPNSQAPNSLVTLTSWYLDPDPATGTTYLNLFGVQKGNDPTTETLG